MSRIRSGNTQPERDVRRVLRSMGYTVGPGSKHLPAKPDVSLARYRAVILVHGCFWHRHAERDGRCRITYTPKNRRGFWQKKFRDNVVRDRRTERAFRRAGWGVLTVWQCQLKNPQAVAVRLDRLLRKRARKLNVKPPDIRKVRKAIAALG